MDAIMMNPPLSNLPPGADGTEPKQENERHMSSGEAIAVLAGLAADRRRTADEVTALQMGAQRLLARHFQRNRSHARRRERTGTPATPARVQPLSPEEELAATVARQRGDMCHED